MKKFNKILAATIVLSVAFAPSSFAAGTTAASSGSFGDLDKASFWSKESIAKAKELGFITGYEDGTFHPLETISREQIAAILSRVLKLDTPAVTASTFADVSKGDWSHSYIEAVSKAGVMIGDSNGKFRPNDLITREELAAVLVRAAKANTDGKGANLTVADKNLISGWAKDYVQTAIELGLLKGDGTNFNPTNKALRQEIAVTALRLADLLMTPAIDSVSNDSVTINGQSYQVTDQVKGILNNNNNAILSGARIKFETTNNTVTKITFLEITKGGQSAATGAAEFSGNLVLDGGNGTVEGNVKVSANFITLKNLIVKGDLEITKELQNDFYSNNLKVNGKTVVNGGDSNTVVFDNAVLGNVEVNKQGVRVEPKGSTTVSEITVNSDANITADANVKIEKLTLQEGAKNVEINAAVKNLVVTDPSVKITLSANAKIENVSLPAGQKIEDVVKNYDQVKQNIEKVDGTPATPPVVGGGGGGWSGGGYTPVALTGKEAESYVKAQDFGYWDDWNAYEVGFQLQLGKIAYTNISKIEVSLVGSDNKTLATRTATDSQIAKLKADDKSAGVEDGQLSVAFTKRDKASTNDWWNSTPYDFTKPSKTVIKVTAKNGDSYSVENSNLAGDTMPVTGSEATKVVETQDFGVYVNDAVNFRGYSVGFRLINKTKVQKVEVNLYDGVNLIAKNTSTNKLFSESDQLSSAFDVTGDFHDNYWTSDIKLDGSSVPNKAVIKVTFNDGTVYKVENNNLTGDVETLDTATVSDGDQLKAALSNKNNKTIKLTADTFTGQFDIERDVTLIGQNGTVIQAPEQLSKKAIDTAKDGTVYNISPVINITKDSNVKLQHLTIDGLSNGKSSQGIAGIWLENAGGEFTDVTVQNIKNGTNMDGMQEGIGIYAKNTDGNSRTLTVTGSHVSGYQKGGMLFRGERLTVNVSNNTVEGAGNTKVIAQNGIQLSDGAKGTITKNTVTGHKCIVPGWEGSATGILVWGTYDGYTIENNDFGEKDNITDNDNDTNVLYDISSKLIVPTFKMGQKVTGAISGVIPKQGETLTVTSYNPNVVKVDDKNHFEITALKGGVATIGVEIDKGNGIVDYGEVEVTVVNNIQSEDDLISAVANAEDGDTIILSDNIKLNNTLTLNKPITLDGNGKTLDANNGVGSGTVTVTGEKAVVKNLNIQSKNKDGAIVIAAPNVTVLNNNITYEAPDKSAGVAIVTAYGSNVANGVIKGNTITATKGMGIYLNKAGDTGIVDVSGNTLKGSETFTGIGTDQTDDKYTDTDIFKSNNIQGFDYGFGFSGIPADETTFAKRLTDTNTINVTKAAVSFPDSKN